MRIALVAVSACLAAALIAVAVFTNSALSHQNQQLTQRINQDSRQISELQSRMVNVSASVDGTHRDLITCADLEQMSWQLSGADSLGGSITGVAGPSPISLPSHCINH